MRPAYWGITLFVLFISCSCGSGNGDGSQPSITIDVLHNNYGVTLVADGVTDNCQAWEQFQAAVPDFSTAYFPVGRYYVDPTACPYGFVLTKHISILGESSGTWDGANLNDATVFLNPITLNVQPDTSVRSLAFDARNGILGANEGVSSGAASTTAGGTTIEVILYVGSAANWYSPPVHAVLLQSGPNNTVRNIRVYYAWHAVAIRASNTQVSNVVTWNTFDIVVKSAADSGDAKKNTLSDLTFDGDPGLGGGLFFTGEASGFETLNNSVSNITCNHSAYCLVFMAASGGRVQQTVVGNVAAQNGGNGVYAFFGDANSYNLINSIALHTVFLNNLTGNGIQNDSATSFCVGDYTYQAISGAPILGAVGPC